MARLSCIETFLLQCIFYSKQEELMLFKKRNKNVQVWLVTLYEDMGYCGNDP